MRAWRPAWLLLAVAIAAASWYIGSLQRDALLERLETQGRQEIDLYVALPEGVSGAPKLTPRMTTAWSTAAAARA